AARGDLLENGKRGEALLAPSLRVEFVGEGCVEEARRGNSPHGERVRAVHESEPHAKYKPDAPASTSRDGLILRPGRPPAWARDSLASASGSYGDRPCGSRCNSFVMRSSNWQLTTGNWELHGERTPRRRAMDETEHDKSSRQVRLSQVLAD